MVTTHSEVAGAVTNLSSSGGKEGKGVAPARQGIQALRHLISSRLDAELLPAELMRKEHVL